MSHERGVLCGGPIKSIYFFKKKKKNGTAKLKKPPILRTIWEIKKFN